MAAGISERNRTHLDRLHRVMKGPFSAAEAAETLGLPLPRTRRLLSWLENRGWLSRVRRGLYTVVPLGASSPSDWREDPWVIATRVFAPCFVGGWSACEHWGLTEQVFRGIVILSGKPLRSTAQEIQGTPFVLRHLATEKHFGLRAVWRERTRVNVSDPSRTLIDILSDPSIGGGVQHVQEVLREYLSSQHRDDNVLIGYARRLANRVVFKRLGFLLEQFESNASGLIAVCLKEQSTGISLLDPTVRAHGRILKRWGLRINVRLSEGSVPS